MPSAWVFVSGMLAEAKAKSFVPQNPLIFRDHVPSSSFFLRPIASFSETRVSPLFEVRVPPVLIEARAASCPRPTCLRFSRSLYLRLGFPICNPKEFSSSYSNTYTYVYHSRSSKNGGTLLLLQFSSLLSNCCITITTTLNIFT